MLQDSVFMGVISQLALALSEGLKLILLKIAKHKKRDLFKVPFLSYNVLSFIFRKDTPRDQSCKAIFPFVCLPKAGKSRKWLF